MQTPIGGGRAAASPYVLGNLRGQFRPFRTCSSRRRSFREWLTCVFLPPKQDFVQQQDRAAAEPAVQRVVLSPAAVSGLSPRCARSAIDRYRRVSRRRCRLYSKPGRSLCCADMLPLDRRRSAGQPVMVSLAPGYMSKNKNDMLVRINCI